MGTSLAQPRAISARPKSRRQRFPGGSWGVVAGLAAVLVSGCADPVLPVQGEAADREPLEVVADAPSPRRVHPTVTGPGTEGELEVLREKAFQLDLRLLEIEGELIECRADLADVAGQPQRIAELEAEVAELKDDLRHATAALQIARRAGSSSAPAAAPPQRRERAFVRAYAGPYTTILGDRVVVHGKLWNGGNVAADAQLQLTLYGDDRRIDGTTLRLRCPPGVDTPYRHEFRHRPRDGTHYLTRAEISY